MQAPSQFISSLQKIQTPILNRHERNSPLAARSQSPWIPVCTVRNKGYGQSQPMTRKLGNAGGASPPQMKPLNYHAINMQTSAKLGLNQISHWGPSGGGKSSTEGPIGGGLAGKGVARGASTGTQAPAGCSEAPRAAGVWRGAGLPLRGAEVCGSRLQSAGGFPGLSAEVWRPPLIHLTRKSQLDQVPPPFFKTNSLNLSTLIRPVKH